MKPTAKHNTVGIYNIYVTVGIRGRTSGAPISAHHLIMDKVQKLRSGILTHTSLVLLQINVEKRVKVFNLSVD